jgi:hypothetical protein
VVIMIGPFLSKAWPASGNAARRYGLGRGRRLPSSSRRSSILFRLFRGIH